MREDISDDLFAGAGAVDGEEEAEVAVGFGDREGFGLEFGEAGFEDFGVVVEADAAVVEF